MSASGPPAQTQKLAAMPRSPTADSLSIELASEEDTCRLGQALAELVESGVVIGLIGPLGAGKTFLVRAIAEALGVDPRAISSPTFVLIHEYAGRLPVYHFDAYRLKSPQAFEDLGPAEYFSAGGVCLIEWADRIGALLPTGCWIIRLTPTGPAARSARIELPATAGGVAQELRRQFARQDRPSARFDSPAGTT
jgi:tRNA threonylcarbamoyladenosine biosynthesis protein TsaE